MLSTKKQVLHSSGNPGKQLSPSPPHEFVSILLTALTDGRTSFQDLDVLIVHPLPVSPTRKAPPTNGGQPLVDTLSPPAARTDMGCTRVVFLERDAVYLCSATLSSCGLSGARKKKGCIHFGVLTLWKQSRTSAVAASTAGILP